MKIIKANGSNLAELRSFVLSYRDESLFVLGNFEMWGLDSKMYEAYMIRNDNYLLGCIFIFNEIHVSFLIDNPKRPGPEIFMLINDFLKLPTTKFRDLLVTNTHGKYLNYILPPEKIANVEFAKLSSLAGVNLSYTLPPGYVIKPLVKEEVYSYYRAKSSVEEFHLDPADIDKHVLRFEIEQKLFSTFVCKHNEDIVAGLTINGISNYSAIVVSIFTVPSHRNKGLASAVLKEVIKKYKTAQRILYCFYDILTLDAGQIFIKNGFVPYEKGYIYHR